MRVEQRLQPRNQVKSKLQIVLSPRGRLGQARLGVMGGDSETGLASAPRIEAGTGLETPREEISIFKDRSSWASWSLGETVGKEAKTGSQRMVGGGADERDTHSGGGGGEGALGEVEVGRWEEVQL